MTGLHPKTVFLRFILNYVDMSVGPQRGHTRVGGTSNCKTAGALLRSSARASKFMSLTPEPSLHPPVSSLPLVLANLKL